MKLIYGILVGIAGIVCCGMTYDITRGGFTENVVDVRVVEVGGHEYVVATSFSPKQHMQNNDTDYRGKKPGKCDTVNVSTSVSHAFSGGSSISLMHHVGCKACVQVNPVR